MQELENKAPESGAAENERAEHETAENKTVKEVVVQEKAGQKKKFFVAVGAALILLLAVIIGISAFGSSDGRSKEQAVHSAEYLERLDLGAKYLEEMDYEQALAAFEAALAIDPKSADAYLGIVEVYIRTYEFDLALEAAKEGYEVTGDERLKEKIDMLESGDIFASNGWNMKERGLQEQLDLGAKYLEEMDYEQALAAFEAALAIDPESADAYLGIVEVYIRTGEFELALEFAKKGYEVTGDERLKEKIDMLEGGDISASNGWIMKTNGYDGGGNLIYWYEYTYNPGGQQASVAKYNAQGIQEQYLELTYDEQGRELTACTYRIDDGNLMKRTREYNGSNYRETLYEDTGDTVAEYADVEVDSDGNELKRTTYYAEGGVMSVWSYEYDGAGRKIRESEYVSNELTWYLIHTYDEKGNLLLTQCYDGSDILQSSHESVYDEEGNLVGRRHYDADGNLQTETVNQ